MRALAALSLLLLTGLPSLGDGPGFCLYDCDERHCSIGGSCTAIGRLPDTKEMAFLTAAHCWTMAKRRLHVGIAGQKYPLRLVTKVGPPARRGSGPQNSGPGIAIVAADVPAGISFHRQLSFRLPRRGASLMLCSWPGGQHKHRSMTSDGPVGNGDSRLRQPPRVRACRPPSDG